MQLFGKTFWIAVSLLLAVFAAGLSFFTFKLETANPRVEYSVEKVVVTPTVAPTATPSAAVKFFAPRKATPVPTVR